MSSNEIQYVCENCGHSRWLATDGEETIGGGCLVCIDPDATLHNLEAALDR